MSGIRLLDRLAGLHRFVAGLLILFGGLAAILPLEQMLPGGYLTGPHAGGGLMLAGIAVIAAASAQRSRQRLALVLATLLVLDGCAGLLTVHGWMTLPEWPGRMSLASSLALVAAGVAIAGLVLAWSLLAQLATLGVLAIALMTILSLLLGDCAVGLSLSDGRVQPVSTSLALVMLALALAGVGMHRGDWCAFYRDRDDRRLTMIGVVIVLLSSLFVGVAGVSLTARAMLEAYDEALLARVVDRASRINQGLELARVDLGMTLDRLVAGEAADDGAALLSRYRSVGGVRPPAALIAEREGGGSGATVSR